MMKRLWAEALDLVRQGGATHVLLKYTDQQGKQIEVQTAIGNLDDNSLDNGIHLDNGDVVFPNPTTAVLNPFLAHMPLISFTCDLNRRADDISATPNLDPKPPGPDSLATPELLSLFPDRDDDIARPGVVMNLSEENVEIAPAIMIPQSMPLPPEAQPAPPTPKPKRTVDSSTIPGEHRGTSCHQCKNARSLEHLAYCSKLFSKRTSHDMRHCRKKFCQGCLTKFYGDSIENSKVAGWVCPSCRGSCRCAACERKRRKSATSATTTNATAVSTPTTIPNDTLSVVFPPDAIDEFISGPARASGGSPSLPDEHVEEEGYVDLAGGKVVKGRRSTMARSSPYPLEVSKQADSLSLDIDPLGPRNC